MSCYDALAPWYDSLTKDVPYGDFAAFYEAEFARSGGEFRLLLDLCCGTGTLTAMMAARGYEMIAADASEDMLMEAQGKDCGGGIRPLFLCQRAEELDLYGTVDAAYCSLDGMNYLPPSSLPSVFRRLRLFIRPGGLLIFDLRTPDFLRELDGGTFIDEKEKVLCLWRADLSDEEEALVYSMDIFSRRGRLWERESEEHTEYLHEPERVKELLEASGFEKVALRTDCPQGDAGRIFVVATRGEEHG